jgi:uncharacterized repeat protein (TIGR01451 family)
LAIAEPASGLTASCAESAGSRTFWPAAAETAASSSAERSDARFAFGGKRVNGDRRTMGTLVARFRLFAAALALLAAAAVVLDVGSRSHLAVAPPSRSAALASSLVASQNPPLSKTSAAARAHNLFAGLPLMFEPNQGQAGLDPSDSRARFVARGSGYSLFLGSDGAILNLVSQSTDSPDSSPLHKASQSARSVRLESLQMKLAGANPAASVSGLDPLPTITNYLIGNDPSRWRTNVPQFTRVRYQDLYPGIDLLFYGNQGRLEYDFQVAPGADPTRAQLQFDGAQRLELKNGDLLIHSRTTSARLAAPVVYQQINGRRRSVDAKFVLLSSNRAGFAIGDYDHSRELVIDPVLYLSTYFGGSGDELGTTVAIDAAGNIYLTGSTTSPTLPAGLETSVLQSSLVGTQNVYIAKITVAGITTSLDYVTYIGGNGIDTPVGIGVDASGDSYIGGTTSSTNFPTTSTAYQTAPQTGSAGTQHVFATELASTGESLNFSTYLSGSGNDIASGMTLDSSGFIYLTGTTTSTNPSDYAQGQQFPVTTYPNIIPFQNVPRASAGVVQFFATKVNTLASATSTVFYSTYFGGGTFATAQPVATGGNIAVDPQGNMYFTGTTNFEFTGNSPNSDFPILNSYQPCLNQAPPTQIAIAPTCSYQAPNPSPIPSDAFVAKINPNATSQGSQLQWSTYVGGVNNDSGTGIALDNAAVNVYLTGTTNSPSIPLSSTVTNAGTYQHCLDSPTTPPAGTCPTLGSNPPTDAFVGRLSNPAESSTVTNVQLTYFSYLGGSGNDEGLALAVDLGNGAVVTGWTRSTDFPVFPTPNEIQTTLNGSQNAFIGRLYTGAQVGQGTVGTWATYFGGSGTDAGTGVAIDPSGAIYVAGQTNSPNLLLERPLAKSEGGQYNGGYDSFLTELQSASSLSITGVLTLGNNQAFISAGNPATFTYTITNGGPDLATNVTVTDNIEQVITQLPVQFVSATASSGTCNNPSTSAATISCLIPSLQAGSTAIVTIVLTPTASNSGIQGQFNGGQVTATAPNNTTTAITTVPAQMSDFTLSVSPTSYTVPAAGDSAFYTIQLTPHPQYITPISLSVSGLPAATGSSFSTQPVNLQGSSPGSTVLTISTTTRPINVTTSVFMRHFYAIWLPIPGFAFIGLFAGAGRRRRRLFSWMFFYLLIVMIVFLPSCSGQVIQPPATGTPAGTFTITLTATSGSDSKSTNILLTVP